MILQLYSSSIQQTKSKLGHHQKVNHGKSHLKIIFCLVAVTSENNININNNEIINIDNEVISNM